MSASLLWRLSHLHGPRLASAARRRAVLMTHGHADIRIDTPTRLGHGFSLQIPEPARFWAGPACDFRRDFVCELGPGAQVEIGAGSIFTSSVLVQISTSLTIGRRCVFAQSVLLADGNHRFRDHTLNTLDQGYDFRPLVIGDGALVLAKATVLASVGAGAVIGAGSVVTRDIPPYCLAVGAPARVIEYFGPEDQRPAGLEG